MSQSTKGEGASAGALAMIASGFALWAGAFVVLYGVQALGCRLAWNAVYVIGPLTLQRLVQVLLYLGALAALATLYAVLRRQMVERADGRSTHFLHRVSAHSGLAALVATAVCFGGVFWLTDC
jgi:hypothetical protein